MLATLYVSPIENSVEDCDENQLWRFDRRTLSRRIQSASDSSLDFRKTFKRSEIIRIPRYFGRLSSNDRENTDSERQRLDITPVIVNCHAITDIPSNSLTYVPFQLLIIVIIYNYLRINEKTIKHNSRLQNEIELASTLLKIRGSACAFLSSAFPTRLESCAPRVIARSANLARDCSKRDCS